MLLTSTALDFLILLINWDSFLTFHEQHEHTVRSNHEGLTEAPCGYLPPSRCSTGFTLMHLPSKQTALQPAYPTGSEAPITKLKFYYF